MKRQMQTTEMNLLRSQWYITKF